MRVFSWRAALSCVYLTLGFCVNCLVCYRCFFFPGWYLCYFIELLIWCGGFYTERRYNLSSFRVYKVLWFIFFCLRSAIRQLALIYHLLLYEALVLRMADFVFCRNRCLCIGHAGWVALESTQKSTWSDEDELEMKINVGLVSAGYQVR